MLGLIEWEEGITKPYLEPRKIMSGVFLALRLGKTSGGRFFRRRIAHLAKRMHDQGVRSAVFPADFPYETLFARQGILPVDPIPLRRALCASYVCRRLETLGIQKDRAVIAVAAQHMGREAEETVRTLALKYRYVLVSVSSGGEAFARDMLRRYGVALLLDPTEEQLDRADALILFSPRPDLRQENKVLCILYPEGNLGRDDMELKLGDAIMAQAAPGCSEEQLAAALHSMGVLSTEMIKCEITC